MKGTGLGGLIAATGVLTCVVTVLVVSLAALVAIPMLLVVAGLRKRAERMAKT